MRKKGDEKGATKKYSASGSKDHAIQKTASLHVTRNSERRGRRRKPVINKKKSENRAVSDRE